MIVFCFYKVSKFELTVELTIELTENDKVKNSFSLFFMEKLVVNIVNCRNKECTSLVKRAADVILAAVNELFQLEIR